MDDYRSVWTTPDGPAAILAVTVLVGVIHLLAVLTVSVTVLPHALVVPLAIVLGPAAVWGAVLGAVFSELVAAGVSLYPVVLFADLLVCGIVARELWNWLPNATLEGPASGVVAVVPIAITAAVIGSGIAIVLSFTLLGTAVGAYFPAIFIERLAITAILAPLVVGVGYWQTGRMWEDRETSLGRWVGTVGIVALVALGWVLVMFVFDLVQRDVQMIPEIGDAITGVVPPPVDAIVAFMLGPQAWTVHLFGGLVAIALIGILLRVGLSQADRSN